MNRACGLAGLFVVVGVVVCRAEPRETPTAARLRVGFSVTMFPDRPPELIKAAAGLFPAVLKKVSGSDAVAEVLPDPQTVAAKLKAGEIDLGVLHGFEFAWVKDTPGLTPVVVAAPRCGSTRACLVVHADSKATGPADLQGRSVVVPVGCKAYCRAFYARVRAGLPAGRCEPADPGELSPADALDAVAGGTRVAALVDLGSLTAYRENTPGLGMLVRVLATSEELPPAVVVTHTRVAGVTVEAARKGLLGSHTTTRGKVLAAAWGLRGFEEVPAGYDKHLERCLKAYPAPAPDRKK